MKKTFYITTPIYYPSGKFHIGTAYCTTLVDSIKRYKELRGYDAYMLTGLDEHGQKIQTKAEENNVSPQEFVDDMAKKAKDLWKLMDISYDDFKKLMPKNTLASQINLLDKLYKEEKITRNEYKSYILSAKNAVHELCEMERITPSECEDSILLPFKYGAVSMASKTNAKIVPFGVTGHYVKNSNDLTVSFAKPLDVNNYNSLEEANLALRENVKSLVKQNINSNIK